MPVAYRTAALEAYLSSEGDAEVKHEFVNGEAWAMAGADIVHNLIASNLLRAIGAPLAPARCRILGSDQRVLVAETGLYCYPDLTVQCGRPQLQGPPPVSLKNPVAVVEVLSPSTAALDREVKFAHYRRCESIHSILLVSQPERRVEVYTRGEGSWTLVEGRGSGEVAVPALGLVLELEEVYRGIEDVGAG